MRPKPSRAIFGLYLAVAILLSLASRHKAHRKVAYIEDEQQALAAAIRHLTGK